MKQQKELLHSTITIAVSQIPQLNTFRFKFLKSFKHFAESKIKSSLKLDYVREASYSAGGKNTSAHIFITDV